MYWIIIVGLILWVGICIYVLIRNQFVYKERIKMNELIFEKKDGRYKHSFETIKCLNREVDLVMDIWKIGYIKKQLDINPHITKEELSKKIKNAKRQKFHQNFLIFEHPDYPYDKNNECLK